MQHDLLDLPARWRQRQEADSHVALRGDEAGLAGAEAVLDLIGPQQGSVAVFDLNLKVAVGDHDLMHAPFEIKEGQALAVEKIPLAPFTI